MQTSDGHADDARGEGAEQNGEQVRGEISREPHYFTEGSWINKREVLLSGWPINRKAQHLGRINAGGTNMAKKMLARMEKERRSESAYRAPSCKYDWRDGE